MLLEVIDQYILAEYVSSRFVKAYMKFIYSGATYYLVRRTKNTNITASNLEGYEIQILYEDCEAPNITGNKHIFGWAYLTPGEAKEIDATSNRQASLLLMR